MPNKAIFKLLASFLLLLLVFSACKKNQINTSDASLSFSKDTLMFDTVFTATGNSTRTIKIINEEPSRIKISSIRLSRGNSSPYFLNVNGDTGKEISDVDLEGNDSLYVFASIYVDPTNENNPFIIEDRLVVTANGKEFTVPFLAYGQNAVYIKDSVLQSQTWSSSKPYVIVQNALVDEGQTLTINAGTKVYVHADSRLFVTGTLRINGTKTDSVVFQGDRIDRRIYYGEDDFVNGVGGEWGGLYFTKTSINNVINYAVFKNGGASTRLGESFVTDATIQLDPDTINNGNPKLHITNSIVRNSGGYGILAFNSSMKAENCLMFACAKENVALIEGGTYDLNGCTIASYAPRIQSATEQHFAMLVLNFLSTGNNTYTAADLNANMRNCIIYGNTENELFVNKVDDNAAEITLQHCLIKTKETFPSWVTQINCIFNEDPLFVETNGNDLHINDYHLKEGSPAIQAGSTFPGMLFTDLDGKSRIIPPCIGCYEF